MVDEHVNMPDITEHEKNMGFLDLETDTQGLALWLVNHCREIEFV